EATALSFLVIGPDGTIGRVMSAPRTSDVNFLVSPSNGVPGIDEKGRLVYRGVARPGPMMFEAGKPMMPPTPPDSAPIFRVDLATRKLDTVAWIKTQKITMNVTTLPNGGMMLSSITNPMPTVDDWAVLSDGSVALIRGRDYHIDWKRPDGSVASSPKISYDWQRLSDDDKVAVIDSAKKAIEAMRATNARRD